jgi:hypothetical protein
MKRALTVIAALAAVYALIVTWRKNERAAGLDFYIYYVNAQLAARADVADIYAPETQERVGEEYFARAQASKSELFKYDATRRRRLDNVSSPFLYTTLRLAQSMSSRDYDRALRQYHALVLFAFIAGVLLICRRVRVSWASSLFLLAALLPWYRGFEADLRVGNVNSLQLLLIGALLWCPPIPAGILLGLLVAFKPNMILIAILLSIRDWRRIARSTFGVAIGVTIAIVAAAINYGSFNVWLQWLGAANQFWHRLQGREERNVAPALSLFQQYGTWVSYAIAALLLAIVCYAIWKGPPEARTTPVLIAGLAILIYLISAPVVWLHYMVLVLPLALALLRRRATAAVSLIALAMIAEVPYELLFRTSIYPRDAALITPALLALFAAGVWALMRSDGDEAAV